MRQAEYREDHIRTLGSTLRRTQRHPLQVTTASITKTCKTHPFDDRNSTLGEYICHPNRWTARYGVVFSDCRHAAVRWCGGLSLWCGAW